MIYTLTTRLSGGVHHALARSGGYTTIAIQNHSILRLLKNDPDISIYRSEAHLIGYRLCTQRTFSAVSFSGGFTNRRLEMTVKWQIHRLATVSQRDNVDQLLRQEHDASPRHSRPPDV
jgi:hypothetical protein